MRTTLTIDDDVAIRLERLKAELHASLKEVVNDALRAGLDSLETPRKTRKRHKTRVVSLGKPLLANIDNISEALAIGEGEGFR